MEIMESLIEKKKIRQMNSFLSNFFSKNDTFTKFLLKMCETTARLLSFVKTHYSETVKIPI